jgi:hypothetical protein
MFNFNYTYTSKDQSQIDIAIQGFKEIQKIFNLPNLRVVDTNEYDIRYELEYHLFTEAQWLREHGYYVKPKCAESIRI